MVEIKAERQEAVMRRVVIDGNAFYEVDEECERRRQEKLDGRQKQGKRGTAAKSDADALSGEEVRGKNRFNQIKEVPCFDCEKQ